MATPLTANQSLNVRNWFTPQTPKSDAAIDLWILYETGSGPGASNGHVHVNSGYVLQNNVWSVFSGDDPLAYWSQQLHQTLLRQCISAPKIVGKRNELYAGFLSSGQ